MRIQHNIMAMNAYRNYTNNTSALSKNLEKLSSGYKINRAGDDAAGLAISEKMRAQITGLDAAQKNVKDGISLVKTAEGAMQEIQDMLNRMDYLATQSANGTYDNETDRAALQKEVDQLKSEINRIADSANFNGIKLLDGSLDASSTTTNITISGNVSSKNSEGAAGKYTMDTAIAAGTGGKEGGTVQFTVALDNGTSQTVKFTLQNNDDTTPALKNLVAEDGTVYTLANAGAPSQDELTKAVVAELEKTDVGKTYNMSETNGKITFEAKETGTKTPAVVSVDVQADYAATGTTHTVHTAMNVQQDTVARDEGREIDADSITLYNGKNYDDAVFTINGKKFVVMVGDLDADTLGQAGTALNAAAGLGSDVTVLVSDGTNKGLKAADSNFAQNIKKISEVTGLKVTDAIIEATTNGIDAGAGIRLSGSVAGKGGLQLQIGDTADSYNQLRVSVGDMHTKALGVANLDISTAESAAAAIATVKAAINQVSSVRGDLGAYQNRLEHTANNLSVMAENIQDAESTIRDTDVAAEMMSYVKNNILVQSAQAMLAQANQVPQGVLQLLG